MWRGTLPSSYPGWEEGQSSVWMSPSPSHTPFLGFPWLFTGSLPSSISLPRISWSTGVGEKCCLFWAISPPWSEEPLHAHETRFTPMFCVFKTGRWFSRLSIIFVACNTTISWALVHDVYFKTEYESEFQGKTLFPTVGMVKFVGVTIHEGPHKGPKLWCSVIHATFESSQILRGVLRRILFYR